jgi:hypothetical protein
VTLTAPSAPAVTSTAAATGTHGPLAPFLQRLVAAANRRDPGPARQEGAGLFGEVGTKPAAARDRWKDGKEGETGETLAGEKGGTGGRWTSMLQGSAVAAAAAPKVSLRPLDLLAVWRAGRTEEDEDADQYGRAAEGVAAARRSRLAGSSRWRALWPATVAIRRGRARAGAGAAPASKVCSGSWPRRPRRRVVIGSLVGLPAAPAVPADPGAVSPLTSVAFTLATQWREFRVWSWKPPGIAYVGLAIGLMFFGPAGTRRFIHSISRMKHATIYRDRRLSIALNHRHASLRRCVQVQAGPMEIVESQGGG